MANSSRKRLVVNAIPLINVRTGIGRYVKCLYEEMEKRHGDRFEIFYFDGISLSKQSPEGPTDLANWSRHANVFWKLPPAAALLIRIVFHLRRELYFRLAVRGFDLYHETAFFPFRTPPGCRTVFTIHDLSLLRCPEYHPRERVLFFRMFFEKRCRNVARFLTISHFTRNEMMQCLGLTQDRIAVTPLAHDATVFYPRTREAAELAKSRCRLPEQYFLFVGSGDPRKNTRIIPDALARAGLDVPLVSVGWSGWTAAQPKQAEVIELGYLNDEDLAHLYSGALALVYPSLYEGFGLPLLEAMACGCPVICSRAASLPEVAGDAACYLENPQDADELAVLLKEIAASASLRNLLRKQGIARARTFSWAGTADLTRQALQSCL